MDHHNLSCLNEVVSHVPATGLLSPLCLLPVRCDGRSSCFFMGSGHPPQKCQPRQIVLAQYKGVLGNVPVFTLQHLTPFRSDCRTLYFTTPQTQQSQKSQTTGGHTHRPGYVSYHVMCHTRTSETRGVGKRRGGCLGAVQRYPLAAASE